MMIDDQKQPHRMKSISESCIHLLAIKMPAVLAFVPTAQADSSMMDRCLNEIFHN